MSETANNTALLSRQYKSLCRLEQRYLDCNYRVWTTVENGEMTVHNNLEDLRKDLEHLRKLRDHVGKQLQVGAGRSLERPKLG